MHFNYIKAQHQVKNPYWQQRADYNLKVTLDTVNNRLRGHLQLTYFNQSPQALDTLWFHLWPNAYASEKTELAKQLYRNGNTNLLNAAEKQQGLGKMDSLAFSDQKSSLRWGYLDSMREIAWVHLSKPLLPNQNIVIETPFKVKIPKAFSRMMYSDAGYAITQWYPKVAVFDSEGWHTMPYLDQGEFYNNFGNYDVSITAPGSYVIAATGEAQTQEQHDWVQQLIRQSNRFIQATNTQPKSLLPYSETKTWRFKQDSVIDFAWFASPFYLTEQSQVWLPLSNRNVKTFSYYLQNDQQNWKGTVSRVNEAINFFSNEIGEYPYNVCTIVEGPLLAGGGMEYPTITVIDNFENPIILELIIVHEIGHNWFYGILASNERKYPWMDEGFNSYYENRYIENKYTFENFLSKVYNPVKAKIHRRSTYEYFENWSYRIAASTNTDQAINTEAAIFSADNYGNIAYKKTSAWLHYLAQYLGEKKFNAAMRRYYETWKFKHPKPADVQQIFEQETGEDLAWFFEVAINSVRKPDFKITRIKNQGNGQFKVVVKDKGKSGGPIPISAIDKTGNILQTYWVNSQQDHFLTLPANTHKLRANANLSVAEHNLSNNQSRLRGLFPNVELPSISYLLSPVVAFKPQINVFGAFGYNRYDGAMIGLNLNNIAPIEKATEINIFAAYGRISDKLASMGKIAHHFYPLGNRIRAIRLELPFQQFSVSNSFNISQQYRFLRPTIRFDFDQRGQSFNKSALSIEALLFEREFAVLFSASDAAVVQKINYNILQANYKFNHTQARLAASYQLNLQHQINQWTRLSATATLEIPFHDKPNKRFMGRIFGGYMLQRKDDFNNLGFFTLSAYTGQDDYLFEGLFIGRSENKGFWSQQILERDGNFHLVTPAIFQSLGRNNNWLTALNLSSNLPGIIPFRLFADLGTFANAGKDPLYTDQFLYVGGVSLPLFLNSIEVFFPMIMSKDLQLNVNSLGGNYLNRVTFTLRLLEIKPLKELYNLIY